MTDANDSVTIDTNAVPPPNNTTATNTNTGFITGVQPATQVPGVYQQPAQPAAVPQTGNGFDPQAWENRDRERGEQVQGVQSQLAEMQEEIRLAREAREAAEAARAQEEQARLDAERMAEEEKLSATELVNKVRTEMQEEFNRLRADNEAKDAILEQERRFNALQEYRASRLADPEIASSVMPHLHQYIQGSTEAEIEDAIARAAQTSAAITNEVAEYQQAFRQGAVGVSTAVPSSGPLEAQQSQQSMSAEQIAALNPAEYARMRPALLRAASQQFRQGR